jgi:hypothetical protein
MRYLILLLVCCLGCTSKYHLKKMKYHELQAIAKGAVINYDTIRQIKEFKFPGVSVKFEPKLVRPEDKYEPIIVYRDSVRTEIKWKKGINGVDTVEVATDCPDQVAKAETDVLIKKEYRPAATNHWPWWVLLGFILGAVTVILLSKFLLIQVRKPSQE